MRRETTEAHGALRRALDGLYDGCAALAALFMVGLLVMVMLSILGRQFHFNVPGIDAYAGYMMAGAGFLALAHTLKRGEHIRVTLIIDRLKGVPKKALEGFALIFGSVIAGTLAFYSVRLVLNSYTFNDISQGVDATPLWIPQIGMAVGTVILFIAFVDDLLLTLLGRPVSRLARHSQEPAHME